MNRNRWSDVEGAGGALKFGPRCEFSKEVLNVKPVNSSVKFNATKLYCGECKTIVRGGKTLKN